MFSQLFLCFYGKVSSDRLDILGMDMLNTLASHTEKMLLYEDLFSFNMEVLSVHIKKVSASMFRQK